MNIKSRQVTNILPVCFSFFLCILILWIPLRDTDFWWHLRLGELMLAGNGIPRTEAFSFTMQGRPFVDFYWLSEVIIAFLYRHLHPFFLSFVFALIGALALYIRLYQKQFGWRSAYVILALAVALMLAFGIRPLVFSWLFFSTLLLLVDHLKRLRMLQVVLISFVLFVIWTNMHDGLVLPLAYLLLLFGIHSFFFTIRWLQQEWAPKAFLTNDEFKKLTILIVVAFIATLVNPYGIDLWKTLVHEGMSSHNKDFISEWQALTIRHQLGFIYFIVALFTFTVAAVKKLWQPHQWIIHTLLFIIGAAGAVHSPFFLILIAPTTVRALMTIHIPKNLLFYTKLYVFPLTLLGALLLFLFQWYDIKDTPHFEGSNFPHKAIEAIKDEQLGSNVFNEYAWGGYIGYHLPQYKLFIDGRMSSWKHGETALIEDHVGIETLKPNFEKKLADYNPDWFFIPTSIPLVQWLKARPEYRVVYEDDTAIVITKK